MNKQIIFAHEDSSCDIIEFLGTYSYQDTSVEVYLARNETSEEENYNPFC